MGGGNKHRLGFTIVELMIVIIIIAMLATIVTVSYRGIQQRSATVALETGLNQAWEGLGSIQALDHNSFGQMTELPDELDPDDDVVLTFYPQPAIDFYEDLSEVQNGALFYDICKQLIADDRFSKIHPKDGGAPQTVVMSCDHNVSANSLLITGWDSKTWSTPVTKTALQDYINSVPYDDWWVDRQDVVRGFYQQMISLFERSGGTFPITSFWDPWANEWSGVPKETLPEPTPADPRTSSFCVQGYHQKYPDKIERIDEKGTITEGAC